MGLCSGAALGLPQAGMVDAVGVESRNLESRKQKSERQRRNSYRPRASSQEHGANMVKRRRRDAVLVSFFGLVSWGGALLAPGWYG